MSLINRFFKKKNAKEKIEISDKTKKEISIADKQKLEDGRTLIHFNFPDYQNDSFCLEYSFDEFTNIKTIKPFAIHSYMDDKISLYSDNNTNFRIGLLYKENKMHLTLGSYQKELKIFKEDKFSLLFENKGIVDFIISRNGYKVDKDSDGVIIETISEIELKIVDLLVSDSIKKWRYLSQKDNSTISGSLNTNEKRNIKELAKMFQIIIKRPEFH